MGTNGYWDLDKNTFVEAEVVEAEVTNEAPTFDSVVGKGEDAYHQVFYDSDGLGIEHHRWIFPPMQDWGHTDDPHSRGFFVPGVTEPVVLEWQNLGPMGSFPDYVGLRTGTSYAVRDLRYRSIIEYKRQKSYWQTPEGKKEANFWTSTNGRLFAMKKEAENLSIPSYRTWARDFGQRVLDQPKDIKVEHARNDRADRALKVSLVLSAVTVVLGLIFFMQLVGGAENGALLFWGLPVLFLVPVTVVSWLITGGTTFVLLGDRSKHNTKETVKWGGAGIGYGLLVKRLFF